MGNFAAVWKAVGLALMKERMTEIQKVEIWAPWLEYSMVDVWVATKAKRLVF